MFKDIELKLNYHKEKLITSFIKRGIYPDNILIQSNLDSLEARLSIFKRPLIKEGSKIDINEINNAIKLMYDDLKILYELLYSITIVEYNSLNYYIDSHLRDLETLSNMYLRRAELESYSTALGTSLLFKYNDFDIDRNDNKSTISLGEVDIADTSRVACIANIDNIDHSNIVFKFVDNEGTALLCNSYTYNKDFISFPGETLVSKSSVEISESQKINSYLELPVSIADTSSGKIITLAGKDKILYKRANENGEIIEEKPIAINSLSFNSHSYIDFYVVDGSSITFRFNKNPISTNFNTSANRIEELDYIHHFFIECDENFSFDFEIDKGSVYAIKENTIVKQNTLLYSGQVDVKEFLIVQTLPKEIKTYNAYMEVYDQSITEDDIKSIMIKKVEGSL